MTTPPQDQPEFVQPFDPTGSTEGAYPVENPNPSPPPEPVPDPPVMPPPDVTEEDAPPPSVGTTQDDVIQGDARALRHGA